MKFIRKYFPEAKVIVPVFLIWRLWLFLVGFVAQYVLYFRASFPYIDEELLTAHFPQWVWHWGNFDGVHYLYLAKHGYSELGLQAFFPIYPLVIRFFDSVIKNPLLTGLLISNISIFLASVIFHRLLSRNFDKNTAFWGVTFLYFFPTSFYFGAIYTESLFILLIFASFYFKGVWGALFGGIASGLRLVGVFLFPSQFFDKSKRLWSFLTLSGVVSYVVYLWLTFHNPIIFLSGQAAFSNERDDSFTTLVSPPQVLWRYFKIFLTLISRDDSGVFINISNYALWIAMLELFSFLFGMLALTWITYKRKVPFQWLIFSWLSLLLPTFSGTLSSMPRYLLVAFPVFVMFAQLKSKMVKIILTGVFVVFLSIFTALFTRGYWVS